MDRSALVRAWGYLAFSPFSKLGAMFGAALSGLVYVVLLLVLGLYADLLAFRGLIPNFAGLSEPERQAFRNEWNGAAEAERRGWLETLAPKLSEAEHIRLARPVGTDAADAGSNSVCWQAYVANTLERRAGTAAAAAYRQRATSEASASQRADAVQLGALSLVVRARNHPAGRAIGWLAGWNTWTWKVSGDGVPNRPYLLGLLILTAFAAFLQFLSVNAMHHFATRATLDVVTRLRRMVYHHAQRLGSLTISEEGPTEAIDAFTQHVEAVRAGLYARLTLAIREPVKIVLLVAVALLIHPWLALAFLFTAGLVWLLGRQITGYYRQQSRQGMRTAANQFVLLQESVRMMRLVKGFLMELFNQARVERQLAEFSKGQLRRVRGEAIDQPLVVLLGTLAAAAWFCLAGWLVFAGTVNVAGVVVLVIALTSLYVPIESWLEQRPLTKQAEESATTLFEFLDRRGEVGQVVGAEFMKTMTKQLEFDRVALRDPASGRMVLSDLTMTIPAGKRVAIVSGDEAEKHALVSLIPRFLDPTSGEIRMDGRNIRWVTLDSLRNQVALVLQQNLIFNDTVANNIGCGDPSYSIPQIIEAAKQAHAHNFVQRLSYGYETLIGDLGHSLRPSEKFRIALARAILRDPAVLIIEEPNTHLEEKAKAMLDDAYDRVLAERTVIFLPHRVSTVKSCDHVYLINDGKLAAAGEHRQLLQENELYRHLYYLEYNIFAERA